MKQCSHRHSLPSFRTLTHAGWRTAGSSVRGGRQSDKLTLALKHLRFLPLAFVAGVDGFNLFAPYLALVIAATPLIAWLRRRRNAAALPSVELPVPSL